MDSPPDPPQWARLPQPHSHSLPNESKEWVTAHIPSCLESFNSTIAPLLKKKQDLNSTEAGKIQHTGFSSVTQSCLTLGNPTHCSTPGFPVHHLLPELAQIHVHWVGDAIQPSHPLLSPSIFPSIKIFSSESVLCIRWPKYWSFSFSISPFSEYSGLIFFRVDWLDLLAVQGTLSLLQHHSWKASILQCSAFFMVQFSHHTWLLEKP